MELACREAFLHLTIFLAQGKGSLEQALPGTAEPENKREGPRPRGRRSQMGRFGEESSLAEPALLSINVMA